MPIITSSPDDDTNAAGQLRIIANLKDEINKLKGDAPTRVSEAKLQAHMGRSIRRLVSLFDTLGALVAENDRRSIAEEDGSDDESTNEQDRLYRGFKELIRFVPLVKTVLDGCDLEKQHFLLKNLRKGAEGARGDDTGNLKPAVVRWVAELFHSAEGPQPLALEPTIKYDRGFVHHDTGRLLCPSEHDWSKEEVQRNIRDGHADFMVTAQSWPIFLYENFQVDPEDFEKGLFKSSLLLKAFLYIFTSPSSSSKAGVENDEPHLDSSRPSKRRKGDVSTRANVAALCNLHSVTPRSIAYITTQLRFALSSSGSWTEHENDFNYAEFYNAIVDYFEVVPGPAAQARIDELLRWWTRKVFGRPERSRIQNGGPSITSMSRMAKQRAARELGMRE